MIHEEPLQQHLDTLFELIRVHPDYILTDDEYRFEDCNGLYVCRDEASEIVGYFPVQKQARHVSNIGIIRTKGGPLLIHDSRTLAESLFASGMLYVDVSTLENSKGHRYIKLMTRWFDIQEHYRQPLNKGVVIHFRVRPKPGLVRRAKRTLKSLLVRTRQAVTPLFNKVLSRKT